MPRYQVHDVKSDGSCFYRSIFYLLKFHGYLRSVCNYMFGKYIDSEEAFVSATRKYISYRIAHNKDGNHIHTIFRKLSEDDSATYDLISEGMPSWFRRKFPRLPKDERIFREQIAHSLLNKTSWASEIDIPIFMASFRKVVGNQVQFVIVNQRDDTPNGLPKKFKMEKDKMYLLNMDELHYNYILKSDAKECPERKIRNPRTRRCVKVDGRVGNNLMAIPRSVEVIS